VPSFLIGFVANRYLTDMLPALVVPAAAALAVVARPRRLTPRSAQWASVALLVWGLWVNVALATWTQNLKEPGFTQLRYDLDDAVFGGAPPSVITLVPGAPAPRDGVVAIDGECDGLYIAEQRGWVALELADGVRRLAGTAAIDAGSITVQTAVGDITIAFEAAQAQATYVPDDGEAVVGPYIGLEGDRVSLEVLSDPVSGRLLITVDGQEALFAFAAPALVDAAISDSLTVVRGESNSTPICHDLAARR
jgi:hypothetical protein